MVFKLTSGFLELKNETGRKGSFHFSGAESLS
jgi:hypothetical protein